MELKEYVVFHQTRWDDIHDKKGNIVMPRTNNYWLEGFWGLDDCKDWVAEGNKKGSKTGAVTLENIFVVRKDKLVQLAACDYEAGESIIVCVKTFDNVHRWKEVFTKEEAHAFVESFENVVDVFAFTALDIEVIEE